MRTKLLYILLFPLLSWGQNQFSFAVVKYNGGGDWYANPTAVKNLSIFCQSELGIEVSADYDYVELSSQDIFNYPILFLTGHGNIILSAQERKNLKLYLEAGGFLHIDDNYGLDEYIRNEILAVFDGQPFTEIGASHKIFSGPFDFPEGLPKIHEHDGNPPQAFALYIENRMAVFYTFECDLNDGWEDPEVHNDPEEIHLKALQMGANIVSFVLNGQ